MRIDPNARMSSPITRGASNFVNKPSGTSQGRTGSQIQGASLKIGEWKEIAQEISTYFKLAAEEIAKPLPKPIKRIKNWMSFDVPIDDDLLLSLNIGRELNFRMFEVALKEVYGITNYSRFTIRFIMEKKVWRIGKPNTEHKLKMLIASNLDANKKTIKYSTPDLKAAVNFYFRWKKEQRARFRKMDELRRHAPDVGMLIIKDFYRGHWNGLVGVLEGLGNMAWAPVNLAHKVTGSKTRYSVDINFAKAEYETKWGKKHCDGMETGVAFGLPVGWLSKAPALLSKLPLIERMVFSGSKVQKAVRVIMFGTAISDITLTVWELTDLFRVLYTGKITVNGITRDANEAEIASVKEQLVSFGLNLVLDAGVSHAAIKKQPHRIGRAQSKVEEHPGLDSSFNDPEHPSNSDWSLAEPVIIEQRRQRVADYDATNPVNPEEVVIRNKHNKNKAQAQPLDILYDNPTKIVSNLNLKASQERAAAKLFGSKFARKRGKNRKHWKKALDAASKKVRPEKVNEAKLLYNDGKSSKRQQIKAKRIMREEYNRLRQELWKQVARNPQLVKQLKEAGLNTDGLINGRSPYYEAPDGRKERLTLEHEQRVTDNPIAAGEPRNLMPSLGRENSGMLERIRQLMPERFWKNFKNDLIIHPESPD